MSPSDDDDRTTLAPSTQGKSSAAAPATVNHALPVGTQLAEFEVTGVLGAGGFGIVYCAYDRRLERHVAVKEFMPAGFAVRDAQGGVHPCNDASAEAFEIGLRSFVNEARLLAQFDAPSLVKVYRFWGENGTAYMVMPYYRGRTLKQAVTESDALAAEPALRRLLDSILDALAILHAQQCYHRDIAPDNILMLEDDRPVLLDFGAARRAIGDMPQAFTTIFKQAYAPIEQISDSANLRQGPWTDLFALAGVVHYIIDGQPPPPAVGRMVSDTYVPLAQRYAHRYSAALLEAIDGALAVRPQDRPQSVQQMSALLGQGLVPDRRSASAARGGAAAPASPPPGAPPATRRWPLAAAGAALGLVLVAGVAYWFAAHQGGARPAPAADAHVAAAPSAPAASAPAPAPAPAPFDPVRAFEQIVAGADPDAGVEVAVPSPKLVINRDRFGFTVRSRRPGYVYVLMLGNDGGNPQMIFPNAVHKDNRIAAGQALEVPGRGIRLVAGGPPGVDHLVAIVSERPREFAAAGLAAGPLVSEFPLARLREAQGAAGLAALLVGSAVCPASGPCPQRYGAAGFSVEEAAR